MNTATKRTASYWRGIAIGMISELYLPTPADPNDPDAYPMFLYNYSDHTMAIPSEVADNIVKLKQLGKTERWHGAIAQWAGMVRESKTAESLRSSFLQGMIYAGWAVK